MNLRQDERDLQPKGARTMGVTNATQARISVFLRIGCAVILAGLMLGVAACGQTSIPSSTQLSGQNTATSATPTSQAGATMTPKTQSSPQPPGSAGVTLTLNQRSYSIASPILVTIHNSLKNTIWAADHKTSCTMLVLERKGPSGWYSVGECTLEIATRILPIGAGTSITQRLLTYSGMVTGTYRVTLTYQLGEEGSPAGGGTVYSAEFTVA